MRVLIEFTDVFDRPEWNTGVQRVMRNMADSTQRLQDVRVIPVLLKDGNILNAESYFTDSHPVWKTNAFLTKLDRLAQKLWAFYGSLNELPFVRNSKSTQKVIWIVFKIGCQPISIQMKMCRFLRWKKAVRDLKAVNVHSGDIFIWLGSPITQADISSL